MLRYSLATLNHSPLHGLPTQWEAHLDGAAAAGFRALAPDIFWLRALEAEGLELARLADGMRERGLECMELAGIAIGDEALTQRELEENLRYARALDAEFVNARIVAPIDDGLVERLAACAIAFRESGAPRAGGTRVALEFSRGSKLNGVAEARALAEAVDQPGCGVTLDTWHFFLHPDGPDWESLESLPLDRLANLQLSDGVPYAEGEFGKATMDRRCMPGAGDFDLARLADVLETRGFDGAVVVEVLSREHREASLAQFAAHAALALQSGPAYFAAAAPRPRA